MTLSSENKALRLKPEEFWELVDQAVADLPQMFRQKLENISIAVEDYPSDEVLGSLRPRPPRNGLLGVYIGVPYTARPGFPVTGMMPDRIELYQRNIEGVCRTREEVVEQVRQTIIHEIGHYFGLDERTLRRLESGRRRGQGP
jgi:predicted Zn-dependent protease with MMP-like domain